MLTNYEQILSHATEKQLEIARELVQTEKIYFMGEKSMIMKWAVFPKQGAKGIHHITKDFLNNYYCTCQYFRKTKDNCSHIIAVLILRHKKQIQEAESVVK